MSRSTRSRTRGHWAWLAAVSLGLSVAVGASPALADEPKAGDDEVAAPSETPDRPQRSNRSGGSRRDRREAGRSQEQMLERMTRELSLTEKQQAEVTEILAAQALKRDARREGGFEGRDRGEVLQQMKDMRLETNGQIEAVLDDEQRKKFEAHLDERRKRFERLGGGPGGKKRQP